MDFDKKDQQILRLMLDDSRQSARQMSLKLGLSTVTTISRIKKLEEKKIVRGYTVRLAHEMLGYDLTAVIEITTSMGKMLEIENILANHDNVISVYDITGGSDTLLIAKFKERSSLSEFVKYISTIPGVENTVTHIVLNIIKEDSRLL